jgi:formylglycine-generating enzyme required for sulfatase activity/Mg-chelatase subunit ChlD
MSEKSMVLAALLAVSCATLAQTPPPSAPPPPADPASTAAVVNEGVAYIFLVDSSKSISAEQFEQVKKALNAWIEALGEKDRMAVLSFGNEVSVLVDFTQNATLLQLAAGKLKLADTKTKLHTALLRSIEMGSRKDAELPPRRAIVLLSDGVDDYTGAMNREEVVERIKVAKVPIFAVGFPNPPTTPEKEQALDALKRFAEASGGHYERLDKKTLDEIYIEMRRRIRKLPMPLPAGTVTPTTANPTGTQAVLASGGSYGVSKLVPPVLRKNEIGRAAWLIGLAIVAVVALFLIISRILARLQQQAPSVSPAGTAAKPVAYQARPPIAYLEHAGGVIEVFAFPCTVGAVRDNDVVINHDSISRYHATLEFRQGKFYVTDRDSTNGTRVGGKEVKEGEVVEGARVSFGTWEGVFRVGNPAEAKARPAAAVSVRSLPPLLSSPPLLGAVCALAVVAILAVLYGLLAGRGAGDEFQDALDDGSKGPVMMVLPAGKFFMGDAQRRGKPNEQPVHEAEVGKFAIGKYEVTFAEYDHYCEVTGKQKPNDAGFGRGMNPVINVSWKDAVAYTEWLSEQTGETYRLPSEAEWEYAARGGSAGAFWWGDTALRDNANYGQEACCGPAAAGADRWGGTSPVGSFPANAFGLHDIAGNVFEWTCSSYHEPYSGQEQVCNQDEALRKVFRGGSWSTPPDYIRSAWRQGRMPTDADFGQGFRVAMDL